MTPVEQLLTDLRAAARAAGHRPQPKPWDPPWTREDHEMAQAEARTADRKEGDPGSCPI